MDPVRWNYNLELTYFCKEHKTVYVTAVWSALYMGRKWNTCDGYLWWQYPHRILLKTNCPFFKSFLLIDKIYIFGIMLRRKLLVLLNAKTISAITKFIESNILSILNILYYTIQNIPLPKRSVKVWRETYTISVTTSLLSPPFAINWPDLLISHILIIPALIYWH